MTNTDKIAVEQRRKDLIDRIIRAYHTTRLSTTTASAHILSKFYVQEEFARFEASLRSQETAAGAGWIVSNGSGTCWRTWKDGWSAWTDKCEEATRYARREDAEAVHREDEAAWFVQPFAAATKPQSNDATTGEDRVRREIAPELAKILNGHFCASFSTEDAVRQILSLLTEPVKDVIPRVVTSAELIALLDDPRVAGAVNERGGGRSA